MLQRDDQKKEIALIHQELEIQSQDGCTLFLQSWEPVQEKKALIIMVHSWGESSEQLEGLAHSLSSKGFSCHSYDHRAHGQSEGRLSSTRNFNRLLQDLKQVIEKCDELYPNLPKFIYAYSFGAIEILNLAAKTLLDIQGIAIASPLFQRDNQPSVFKLNWLNRFSKIFPSKLVSYKYNYKAATRDLAYNHSISNDNNYLREIPLKLYCDFIKFGEIASKSIYKINKPLLVLQGEKDKFASVKATKAFIMNAGVMTKYVEFPGAFHELHNDVCKTEMIDELCSWIESTNTI